MQGPTDSDGDIDKETLMRLITQQMVNALLAGDDDEEDEEAIISALQKKMRDRERARNLVKKKSRRRRLNRSDSPPMMPPTPTECLRPGDEFVTEIKSDDSFAGNDLHELVDASHRRSWLNGSARSGGSTEDMTKVTGASSNGSKDGDASKSASRNGSIASGEMSVDELRRYVMENIPQAVREQIPEEAWAQIFNTPSIKTKSSLGSGATPISQSQKPSKSSAPKPPRNTLVLPMSQIEFGDEVDVQDDITVFSDVTGLTGAFPDGKYVEKKRDKSAKVTQAMSKVDEDFSQDSRSANSFRHKEMASSEGSLRSGQSSYASRVRELKARQAAGVKKVAFDQVQVRYYERIVSDNPSVQSGVAIGIGWKYKRGGRVDVDQWEQSRGPTRSSAELVLPRHVREGMLREAGVSQKEIADMVRTTLKVKNQRKQTVNNLSTQGFEEVIEKARGRFTKLLTLGRQQGG